MSTRAHKWMLIAWEKESCKHFSASVTFVKQKTHAQALAYFKSQRKNLRNHTAQPIFEV